MKLTSINEKVERDFKLEGESPVKCVLPFGEGRPLTGLLPRTSGRLNVGPWVRFIVRRGRSRFPDERVDGVRGREESFTLLSCNVQTRT